MSEEVVVAALEPIGPFKPLEGSQVFLAYKMLEEAVRVSRSSRALVVWREAYRSSFEAPDYAAGTVTIIGLMWLTHWWIAVPVTGVVMLWRTRRRALKMHKAAKSRPHSHPDTVEFRNLWALNSWKLVQFVRGFNIRAEATNRLIRDKKKLDAARRMSELLLAARKRLVKAVDVLNQFQPVKAGTAIKIYSISLRIDPKVNARLSEIDPLGVSAGSTELDWLALETEPIHADRFDEVLERDLVVTGDAQDELRDSTSDARFADLEREYGAELDRDLEE